MSDNANITPGSGIVVRADDVGGVLFQIMKLDVGGDGVSKPVVQGGSDGLPVDLLSSPATGLYIRPASGQTFPVSVAATINIAAPSPINVAAAVNAPVFVQLSDGTNPIAALPVSGTVAATQGAPAAASSAWFTKITNGTDVVGISSVSTDRALKVDVIQSVTGATTQEDSATFTAASSDVVPIAGVYDDSVASPTAGQLAGVRITQFRGLHVSLRAAAGTEIGSSGAPLRIDPTGTTAQPVKLKDASGNAFTDANPVPVMPSATGRTRVTKSVSLSASQTAATVWTPASGKKFYITHVDLLITVTGDLAIFDATNAAGNLLFNGLSSAWTVGRHTFDYAGNPWASATADNILKYTTGSGFVGIITLHGFEI